MSRVPIRVRIAAAFALAMAAVLVATGAFLHARLADDLASGLDQNLRLRALDLSALVQRPGRTLAGESGGRLVERGESFAQLLDPNGRVLDASPALGARSLLDRNQRAQAARAPTFVNRRSVPGLDEGARLLATSVRRSGRRLVLVVGATRENRAEALRSLRTELLLAGPIALVLATAIGYLLAGIGLRAVEAMRRRAAAISADQPGERLPVPRSGDELERLGATLNEMLGRLEEALERERAFVAEAGHEVRTPLALLRAELDYALHDARDETELRDAVRAAGEETDRLAQLAGDLLLLAGTERGRMPLHVERCSARELADSVRNRFAWRAEAEGRRVEVDVAEDLVVEGDRLRLEQALSNLVDNALRHGAGTVRLEGSVAGGQLELAVRDGGPGFTPELLARAFRRFSRGGDGPGRVGAGLGLSIVEAIAQAHGGAAEARTEDGGGARVAIRIPLRVPAAAPETARPS